MKATLRGTEIYFDIAGMQISPTGDTFVEKPVLFLLHGGPGGNHLRFKQHSLALQEFTQLVFIDHRGCGRSKKTFPADYTLENNIEDIEALRQHLGLERILILGNSYGGMVAQGYAARYAKNVAKLILVATAPSHHFLADAKINLRSQGSAEQIALGEQLWNGAFTSDAQVADFFTKMHSLYSTQPQVQNFSSNNSSWSYEALNQGFKTFLREFNFIPELSKISCPTLILAGQEDWICPPQHAKILAQHIRRAQLKIFPNCGHTIAIDAQDRYMQAIQDFLQQSATHAAPYRMTRLPIRETA